MAFTPAEVAQVKAYLGYPPLVSMRLMDHGMIQSGATEHLFLVEANLQKVPPEAEYLVRQQLARIACVEQQVLASYGQQSVASVGGVTFNGLTAILAGNFAYTLETDKLADLLHTPKAPTSLLHNRIGGSGEGAVTEPC